MDAIGPAAIVPPGHAAPEDMEPDSEEAVTAWLISMGPECGTEELMNVMAAHGVTTLYDTLFTRADLLEWGIPPIKARRIKEAADALRGRLGLAPVPEDAPVQAEVQIHREILTCLRTCLRRSVTPTLPA